MFDLLYIEFLHWSVELADCGREREREYDVFIQSEKIIILTTQGEERIVSFFDRE